LAPRRTFLIIKDQEENICYDWWVK
jgi:hypothetical protein